MGHRNNRKNKSEAKRYKKQATVVADKNGNAMKLNESTSSDQQTTTAVCKSSKTGTPTKFKKEVFETDTQQTNNTSADKCRNSLRTKETDKENQSQIQSVKGNVKQPVPEDSQNKDDRVSKGKENGVVKQFFKDMALHKFNGGAVRPNFKPCN